MKIIARTIPGCLVPQNKGTLTWGHHGLVAYGANTLVAVVDTSSMEHLTSMHGHRSSVTKITWAPCSLPRDVKSPSVYLVSADSLGVMVLFDVTAGKALQKMSESDRQVNELELFYSRSSELVLLSLHQPALLILWNPATSEQIWKKSFSEPLTSFNRDPFDSSHMILAGSNFVLNVTDLTASHSPSDGHKLYLTSSQDDEAVSDVRSEKSKKSPDVLKRSKLVLNDSSSRKVTGAGDGGISDLIDIKFHNTQRDTLVLIYRQDILLVDLEIKQTISVVSLDRSTCSLMDVYNCLSRDAMYCLHDNGAVVFRVRKSLTQASGHNADVRSDGNGFIYEPVSSTDGMRVTRSHKVFGLAVCPSSELKAAVLTSEGKLLTWQLQMTSQTSTVGPPRPVMCLSDLLRPSTSTSPILDENIKSTFLLTGIASSLSHAPFVVKMCPPLTTKNYHIYQAFVAIGSLHGAIQIYDINSGVLYRYLMVHTCQVRAIEWSSLHSFISHACQGSNSNSAASSELAFVNIRTGKVVNFRPAKADEGPIQIVRVSHLKQYMVIVFKNKPMELWDLKTLTLLREMSVSFPVITALEWSPSALRKRLGTDESNADGVTSSPQQVKEQFVFTDNTGLLHNYTVEGSIIRDGLTIGAQGVTGTVTALAWKNETLSLGDVNSNVSFWDLKNKKSVNWAMSKGMVRKMKFAPGKENNKILILFNQEMQIWDKNTYAVISSMKFPSAIGRVNDADWSASDKIILSIADGYVAIADISLASFISPISDTVASDGNLPACLMSSQLSLRYQVYCQHFTSCPIPTQLNLSAEMQRYLADKNLPVADRCLAIAHVYGDSFSVDFWTIASHYLKLMILETDVSSSHSSTSSEDTEPLESNYHFFCPNESYKTTQVNRVLLQDEKRYGMEARLDCARKFILLGQFDRAVHLLLQSEPDCSSFYLQSLRACLLATVKTSGASQSTIKLVATSLIANGKLDEGTELLCLIEKSADACRYLQTYGHWNEAIWLAKVTLEQDEAAEVVNRWISEHLTSPSLNKMSQAILAAISIGNLMKAIELLYEQKCFSTAAMFIEACTQYQLLQPTEQTLPTIEAVYAKYGSLLQEAGITEGAIYCWKKAGQQHADHLAALVQESPS